MTNHNRKTGTTFEHDLCHILANDGFWCHNLAQNRQGQPFDVIAARNSVCYAIDCKVCDKDSFRLDRIEENQHSAMNLWRQTGNRNGWFALRMSCGEVYLLSLETIDVLKSFRKVLTLDEIKRFGIPVEKWVIECK